MAHKIRVLESGVVEIVHTGDLTITEATASRAEAASLMKKSGLLSVLADVSQTNHSESTSDLFEFNSTHYKVFPSKTCLAVVIPADPHLSDLAHFAETVALNRGIIMRTFLDYNKAMNWLVESDKSFSEK